VPLGYGEHHVWPKTPALRPTVASATIFENGPGAATNGDAAGARVDRIVMSGLEQQTLSSLPSRSEEALRIIAEYQNGLQEIIKKLRQRLLN
jgi:hypothetical protein